MTATTPRHPDHTSVVRARSGDPRQGKVITNCWLRLPVQAYRCNDNLNQLFTIYQV